MERINLSSEIKKLVESCLLSSDQPSELGVILKAYGWDGMTSPQSKEAIRKSDSIDISREQINTILKDFSKTSSWVRGESLANLQAFYTFALNHTPVTYEHLIELTTIQSIFNIDCGIDGVSNAFLHFLNDLEIRIYEIEGRRYLGTKHQHNKLMQLHEHVVSKIKSTGAYNLSGLLSGDLPLSCSRSLLDHLIRLDPKLSYLGANKLWIVSSSPLRKKIVNILKKHSFESIDERTSMLEKGIGEHGYYQDFVVQHFLNKIKC